MPAVVSSLSFGSSSSSALDRREELGDTARDHGRERRCRCACAALRERAVLVGVLAAGLAERVPALRLGAPRAAAPASAAGLPGQRTGHARPCSHCGRGDKRFLTAQPGVRGARLGGQLRVPRGTPDFFPEGAGSSRPAGVARRAAAGYLQSRRGTEPQRARPPRCEAAPPTKDGLRAGRSGFLKRLGTASSFSAPAAHQREPDCERGSTM